MWEVVYVTTGNPAFCLAWYLTGVHFRGELQHVVDGSEQKIKCRPIRTREIGGARLSEELYGHDKDLPWFNTKIKLLIYEKITYKVLCKNIEKSSGSQLFFKIGVLKNLVNFTGKHLCSSLFLVKWQAWGPSTLWKRDSNTGAFTGALQNTSGGCFWTLRIINKLRN